MLTPQLFLDFRVNIRIQKFYRVREHCPQYVMLPSAHPCYICLQILKDGPVFSTGMTYHETLSVLGWHTTVRSSKEFEQQNSVSDQIQWWHCQQCACHHITQYHAILATSKRSRQTHTQFPLFTYFSIPQHDSPSNLAESRVPGLGATRNIQLHPFAFVSSSWQISLWMLLNSKGFADTVTEPGQAGTRPDYLVNRDDQKNEGPLGKKLHRNREIVAVSAEEVWVHRNSWLGSQIGAVLKPNINAQRLTFLSQFLCSPWQPLTPNFWSLSRSL